MADQLLKVRENAQRLKEETIKEAKYQVNYSKNNKLYSRTINARNEDDAEEKAIKRFKIDDDDIRSVVKEETLNEFKKASVEFDRRNKSDMMKAKKDLEKKGHKVDVSGSMITVTAKRGSDIGREIKDVMNFYNGAKRAKALESVEEETLDEAMDKKTAIAILKMKKKEDFYGREGAMIYMSPDERDALKKKVGRLGRDVPGPSKGVSTMIIINTALGKDGTDGNRGDYDTEGKKMINMRKGGKSIGTPRTIGDAMKLAGIREETLDEIAPALMAIGRVAGAAAAGAAIGSRTKEQKINASKMSQLHMYIKQGKTAKEIGKLMGVDPKTIQKLMSAYDAKKIKEEMKIEAAIDEAKLIEKEKSVRQLIDPNKESMVMKKNKVIVIDKKDEDKYLKKGWALAEQDELQIKEWFKSKNIDVKVRELEESTQVYVPIGRRIPNEIREELIITQYGKMPEDVKNVEDINYGNFVENSITMNNDFWSKVLHGTKGE